MRKVELTIGEQRAAGLNYALLRQHFFQQTQSNPDQTSKTTTEATLVLDTITEVLHEKKSEQDEQVELTFVRTGTSNVGVQVIKGKELLPKGQKGARLPLPVTDALTRVNFDIRRQLQDERRGQTEETSGPVKTHRVGKRTLERLAGSDEDNFF